MALAYRAGVGLKDMEMVQFHPTGLPFTGILITEAVRGEGGYLLNNEGERFLKRYVPNKMELGPRDIISRAMITEFDAGRGFEGPHGKYMHLDVRHLGEATIDRKLPFMRELGREFVGIDIVHDPIPVRPVQHYMMGGVDADISGATPVSARASDDFPEPLGPTMKSTGASRPAASLISVSASAMASERPKNTEA